MGRKVKRAGGIPGLHLPRGGLKRLSSLAGALGRASCRPSQMPVSVFVSLSAVFLSPRKTLALVLSSKHSPPGAGWTQFSQVQNCERAPDGIARVKSQNHRMVGVGRDLCGSSRPTLLPKQGHLQ